MGQKLRRRSVYIATIVALLAMVGGFALATGGFLGFGSTSVNGNQGAITTHGTIYDPGISGSLFTTGTAPPGACGATPTSAGSPVDVSHAWVEGAAGACAGALDYVLQLNFTSNNTLTAGTYTDTFVVTSEFNAVGTYTTQSVTIVCTLGVGGTTCQAVISIDTGVPTTQPQPSVNGVDVSVTGS